MDCTEVKELLSAYFDEELASEKRIAVAEHLVGCGECSSELAGFEKLSGMARALDSPMPPAQMWSQLERQLDETLNERSVQRASRWSLWSIPTSRLVTVAATLLVAIGLGWIGYSVWLGDGEHDGFTAEFGQYLDEFHRDPAAAQQFLLAKYESQEVNAQNAVSLVGYRPVVLDGLPDGYSAESAHVMKMPCCTCVQCVCTRSDGTTIAIFEHDENETREFFGDRPATSMNCNGKQCSLVDLNGRIAASWKRDNRHITVVGLRDVAELNNLVAWFDDRRQVLQQ